MSDVAIGQKEPVVYLPGLDGTGKLLFTQTRLLENYEVLCQSYPNDRNHDYRSLAKAAAERIQTQLAGAPATILAESFGGGVAIELACTFPELVGRLILVNTFAKYPHPWVPKLGSFVGRFAPARPSPPWTRVLRNRFLFADDLPQEIRQQWWSKTAGLYMSTMLYRAKLIAGLDRTNDLEDIDVDAVVVVSVDDRLVAPSAGYELHRRLPRARLVKVTGGHCILSHPTFDLCDVLNEAA